MIGTQKRLMLPALIEHEMDGDPIHQRPKDGYINATELCKKAGKQWAHYWQNTATQAFLKELSSVNGIPLTDLTQTIQGGTPQFQGTWVHPQVAVDLARWLSPRFAVFVSKIVTDWVEGRVSGASLPHVQRYMMNKGRIPPDYFSMLNEIYLLLFYQIDDAGIPIPPNVMPDISTGKMFSSFLRSKGIDVDDFPTYEHHFPDGRVVAARLYPIMYLGEFRAWLNEVWFPKRAIPYFTDRFPKALSIVREYIAVLEEQK